MGSHGPQPRRIRARYTATSTRQGGLGSTLVLTNFTDQPRGVGELEEGVSCLRCFVRMCAYWSDSVPTPESRLTSIRLLRCPEVLSLEPMFRCRSQSLLDQKRDLDFRSAP